MREEIERGKLIQICVTGQHLKRGVAMVSLKGSKPAPIRAFVKFVIENKEKLQKLAINQ